MDAIKRGLPPIVQPDVRILILGSLPGDASLAAGQYYAHPRNQFWRILGVLLNQPLTEFPYEQRLDALLEAGVGLWDVIAEAKRPGSLDASIRERRDNDLAALADSLPGLRVIACNGATSYRGALHLARDGREVLALPSTSPAHTLSCDAKLAQWRQLERYLGF